MVKRTRDPMQVALSRVQPRASINPDAGAKHDQAYMHPGNSVSFSGKHPPWSDPQAEVNP
jgi:hypothetical protein